ncbi:hypothetical protein GGX14DRAFT_429345 [Mycena pura]|uniref:Uncharacterized protein n=1 Tax=Mycena pura TaxID=153505 RepID=A0AAD6YHY1_9AGAR|nr:hypothetical protein GGX14DRAFT_429345 [Mycena pura]
MMAFYIQVIWKHGLVQKSVLASLTISLFILCTAHCILILAVAALIGSPGLHMGEDRTFFVAANVVYVTANVLADAIFILRCYAIWNFQKKIIVIPVLLTILGVAGIGYFNAVLCLLGNDSDAFIPSIFLIDPAFLSRLIIGVSLFTTFILMGLTVGRICMLARRAQRVLGAELTGRYHKVCAMILESGALYLGGGIVYSLFVGLVRIKFNFAPVNMIRYQDLIPY